MELWDEALYSSDEAMEFFNFFHKLMLKIVGKDVEIISYEEFKGFKKAASVIRNNCLDDNSAGCVCSCRFFESFG